MFVYVLESLSTGRYYVGSTSDLMHRLEEHNAPETNPSRWTRSRGPWKLVFSKEFGSAAESLRAERFVKRMKSRAYIEKLVAGERSLDRWPT
ncbi:MAG TPA: GIY-YIG nuclease family protein [Candidatus Acidoferrales bacterium]|nr:GIY-YIG nuclease family protein [Candidatus Acidoferrales bacterium]